MRQNLRPVPQVRLEELGKVRGDWAKLCTLFGTRSLQAALPVSPDSAELALESTSAQALRRWPCGPGARGLACARAFSAGRAPSGPPPRVGAALNITPEFSIISS